VNPLCLAGGYQCLGGTPINYKTTRRLDSDDHNQRLHIRENLKQQACPEGLPKGNTEDSTSLSTIRGGKQKKTFVFVSVI
jgi:hypothetical protein